MSSDGRIEKRKKEKTEEETVNLAPYLALAAIIAVIAIVGYVFLAGNGGETVNTNVTAGSGPHPTMVSATTPIQPDNVTVTYYGDYDCPHCKSFEENYLPRLEKEYIETGKIRFVFRPVNFLSENSYNAGITSYCVWNQNKDQYWRWHTRVFSEQRSGRWASQQNLIEYSEDIQGINPSRLRSCLENERYGEELTNNSQHAGEVGVTGTPSVVIDGEVINGNNYERVKSAIDSALQN